MQLVYVYKSQISEIAVLGAKPNYNFGYCLGSCDIFHHYLDKVVAVDRAGRANSGGNWTFPLEEQSVNPSPFPVDSLVKCFGEQ